MRPLARATQRPVPRRPAFAAAGVVAAALAGASCSRSGAEPAPAYFSAGECSRVNLTDARTGAAIIGAEDLALDPARGLLIVSAYDRHAAERAVRRGRGGVPTGGLYRVDLEELFAVDGPRNAGAEPIIAADEIVGGLRPHGVDVDPESGVIAFVNRGFDAEARPRRLSAQIERVTLDGAPVVGRPVATPCAANDVLIDGDRVLASADHAGCGLGAVAEDLLPIRRSGIFDGDAAMFSRARFANGLARSKGGDLILAATREHALIVIGPQDAEGEAAARRRIAVPGGPDNVSLTASADGREIAIAAVHPSLWRIAAQRKLGLGRAPSRVVAVDLAGGEVSLLVDDPHGTQFAAASVAVVPPGRDALIVGSALDDGLLVCRKI